jgi:hypothetical protein
MKPSRWLFAAALAAAPGLAMAQEPAGCGGFKWPLDREIAALVSPAKAALPNGGALAYDQATMLDLKPLADAALPYPPERQSKATQSYAGHFTLAPPPKPGVYRITIGAPGWIDVIDGGQFLHPRAFSGATGCEGARKSVKFDLPGKPLDIQLSDVRTGEIAVIVSPGE